MGSVFITVPTVGSFTSDETNSKEDSMAVKNKPAQRYALALRIKASLADGRVRTISEVAKELGVKYQRVKNALTALTSIEPNLAEEDNGDIFMVIGG